MNGQTKSNLLGQKCWLNLDTKAWSCLWVTWANWIKSFLAETPVEFGHASMELLVSYMGKLNQIFFGRNTGWIWARKHGVACAIDVQTEANLARGNVYWVWASTHGVVWDKWASLIKFLWQKRLLNLGTQAWSCLCDRWANWIKSSSAEMPIEFGVADMRLIVR